MKLKRIEWPTLVLAIACTGTWAASTYLIGVGGQWWLLPVAVLLITLHSSLQHEILHGHPTSNRLLNEALVSLPIGLVFPYRRFRTLHLKHHNDELLTDSFEDPESHYLSPEGWAKAGPVLRAIRAFNNTQIGRFLIGPALSIAGLLREDWTLVRVDAEVRLAWILHLPAAIAVLAWVWAVCGINPLLYFAAFAYPALSVLSIRTFIEHQAREAVSNRSIINEDRGPLALLFLNNSLHFVHHKNPTVAWYRLPRLYREKREAFLAANGGYRAKSYWEIFKAYAVKRKEPVEHPLMATGQWRASKATKAPAIEVAGDSARAFQDLSKTDRASA